VRGFIPALHGLVPFIFLHWHISQRAVVQRFHEISKAYDVLSDKKAKEAFDAVIQVTQEREKRFQEMDAERQKLRQGMETCTIILYSVQFV
jgi:DnaJ-class molecular chaperone